MAYAVMAETKSGTVNALRKGFPNKEAAEDHPVTMSLWQRVWVEEYEDPLEFKDEDPPPKPWSIIWVSSRAYITDANGKKIASLLGSQKKREHMADMILDVFGRK